MSAAGAPGAGCELAIVGALGRMGIALQEAALSAGFRVAACIDHPDRAGTPSPVAGVSLASTGEWFASLDPGRVAIDFSSPAMTRALCSRAAEHGAALVIGTTGLSDDDRAVLEAASRAVPIVFAPNYSVGVNLLLEVTELVARVLGGDRYDAEIVEAHHRLKKDSPSGTALGLAQALVRGRGVALEDVACYGREGMVGERPRGQVGIHAVRGGDIVGDHTVLFAGEGERIELRHTATSRRTFAEGAVRAAGWVYGRRPGLYTMRHVLGFDPV